MIANKPQQPAYISALLPNDQVFDDDIDENEIPIPTKKIKLKKDFDIKEEFDENEEQENEEEINNGDESEIKLEEPIDNPFLRPVKYPAGPL